MSLSRPARALLALLLLLVLVWILAALSWPAARRDKRKDAASTSAALANDVADVTTPALHHLLPHLLQSPRPLRPVRHLGDGPSGDPARRGSMSTLSLAIGVVVAGRGSGGGERVVDVLEDLFRRVKSSARDQTLVVVLVWPDDYNCIEAVRDSFGDEAQAGLLEVISAPDAFYPSHVDGRGNESDARRVLDVSFLMMYCQERAEFYLQLSDAFSVDRVGFATKMKGFAMDLEAKQNWIGISFSNHRFYGNLFLCSELPRIVQFFLMFYNDHNVGDLFENLVHAKACKPTMAPDECASRMNTVWVRHRPPLVSAVVAARSSSDTDKNVVAVVAANGAADAVIR
ncbi:Alpha-1,3-mannosyl-glycoprotein 4-beta-N-acetylglucosaminyltransferase B, partial [Frankliniella fusca]